MMKVLIIVNGKPTAGKDTFVEYLDEILFSKRKQNVSNISSIDVVKHVATILGWDGEKTDEARDFLSNIKDLSTKFNDFPFTNIVNLIDHSSLPIIACHIREPEEIEKLYNHYKESIHVHAIRLFVDRNVEVTSTNHADKLVNESEYDMYIDNNKTLEDYKYKVIGFYNLIEPLLT